MTERPAETVERDDHDDIDLPTMHRLHQRSERGPGFPRAAVASIDKFGRLPATGMDVTAQFEQLVVARLVRRADPRVTSGALASLACSSNMTMSVCSLDNSTTGPTWLGTAFEVQYTTVPDALGLGGVSAAFDEDNLGASRFS